MKEGDVVLILDTISAVREGNPAICDNMDGPLGHYANWNEPQGKTILPGITYIWNLKKSPHKNREEKRLPGAGG